MNDPEADAALDRAADEALALLSEDRGSRDVRDGRDVRDCRDVRDGRDGRGGREGTSGSGEGRREPDRAHGLPDGAHGTDGTDGPDGSDGCTHTGSGSGPEPDSDSDPAPAPYANLAWDDARTRAARSVRVLEPVVKDLADALGHVLAEPLVALTDLPPFDTSAMDGWTVAGPGPWRIAAVGPGILAGHARTEPLPDGRAVRIATGARVPPGATAVLRSEHGTVSEPNAESAAEEAAWLYADRSVTTGQDIRPRGQECRSGDRLLPARTFVTPAVLGMAAAAGYDALRVVPRPRAEVLVLGDELLDEGLPRDGRIRDALGPMLAPWLRSLGAEVIATRRLKDDSEALYEAVAASGADVIVTTGGTASGPVDHVHPTLRRVFAEPLVDGVAVRPGHPMVLARLVPHRHFIGLPGNPLAAVSGLLTLAGPLLRTLAGRAAPVPYSAPLTEAVHGHPEDTRLVPVAYAHDEVRPLRFHGPAMLRGIAAADALAVIPPGGVGRGGVVETLDLPWGAGSDPNADADAGANAGAGTGTGTGTGVSGSVHTGNPGRIDLADLADLGGTGGTTGSRGLGAQGWQGVLDGPDRQDPPGGTSRPGRSGGQSRPDSTATDDLRWAYEPEQRKRPQEPPQAQPGERPRERSQERSAERPQERPAKRSAARPTTQPSAGPTARPTARPTGQPTGTGWPVGRPMAHETLNTPRRLDAPLPFGPDSGALS
ncbi:molybdopterin-binding protein [Streptomyces sp. NPDC050617]|uniref:molybdopterin molybdotransferase MoeA n=1 Tax=Streptomyces sp. NPDC050617 TaxID=3154628 RepID=UPI00343E8B5F